MTPRYPGIHVRLVGQDGNAFAIVGYVLRAMRRHDIPEDELTAFKREAVSGDHNNLLATCSRWVDIH